MSRPTASTAAGPKPSNVDQSDWNALQSALSNSISSSSGVSPSQLFQSDPNSLGNDPQMELQWAEKAGKHSETYFKLLTTYKGEKSKLRLTSVDDILYKEFRELFPEMNIIELNELNMKNDAGKLLWRPFLMKYEKNSGIQDYNFGTLLRINSYKDYSPDNVMVVPRIQFLIIEIARNREGKNDNISV